MCKYLPKLFPIAAELFSETSYSDLSISDLYLKTKTSSFTVLPGTIPWDVGLYG